MPTNTTAHAAAKIRLANRAKRARFWKENKTKILLLAALVVFSPLILAFMPATANWFENQAKDLIKEYELSKDSERLAEAIEKKYNLSLLYSYTLRHDQAAKQWDDIAKWYYGYSVMKWSEGGQKRTDAESEALALRKKNARDGTIGVPYDFPPESTPLLENSLINIAEYLLTTSPPHPKWRIEILGEKYLGKDRFSVPTAEPGLLQRYKDLVDPERIKWAEEQFTLYKGN